MSRLLSIRDLTVSAERDDGRTTLIDQVSLDLHSNEVLGLVGESGSGKSLLCRSVVRLLPSPKLAIDSGQIILEGRDLLKSTPADMLSVRGAEIAMIFQNPTSHLDPVMRIGDQIAEGIRFHQQLSANAAREAAMEVMTQVGFRDPRRQYFAYPHVFSGGMRQRAMIAVALSSNPKILIADEPTTALDVTIQAQILQLLMDIRTARGLSVILVTHDLGVVAQTCDRIAVMQAGRIVERGGKRELLAAPAHPYTIGLIASHPSMPARTAPSPESQATGDDPLLAIKDLYIHFPAGGFLRGGRRQVVAVDGVSLNVAAGDSVGIVGESGSGKSTLARAILGLTPITSGSITFDGADLGKDREKALAVLRGQAAMIFQDPLNALNPRMTVGETIAEVLKVHNKASASAIPERVSELLELVGLAPEFARRRPRSMSGGQCQRAGIARALAIEPKMLIADECVAALDLTIQAQIIDLFRELKRKMDLTLLFIAHDLAIVRNLCDRVVVMHHGRIVEEGRSEDVFAQPQDPYTAALIDAIPDIDPGRPLLRTGLEAAPAIIKAQLEHQKERELR